MATHESGKVGKMGKGWAHLPCKWTQGGHRGERPTCKFLTSHHKQTMWLLEMTRTGILPRLCYRENVVTQLQQQPPPPL